MSSTSSSGSLEQPPSTAKLPDSAISVEDVDEEIFALYTRKLCSRDSATSSKTTTRQQGLGFLDTTKETIRVTLTLEPPVKRSSLKAHGATSVKSSKITSRRNGFDNLPKEIETIVCQDLQALRHRKGDTGSVIWRVSIHLAHHLLDSHFFPSESSPPLFTDLAKLNVLELGSGTGFLGCTLASFVRKWTFTDQFPNLALIQRTIGKNTGLQGSVESGRIRIEELDWIEDSKDRGKASSSNRVNFDSEEDGAVFDLIIASDCIYNPALAIPLATTISNHNTLGKTVVLIASELRDQDALEAFLMEWLRLGFCIRRLQLDEKNERSGLVENDFVVWIGWKANAQP